MARRPRRTRRPVKPFDTTTKYLFELDPAAWLAYAGLPERGTVQLLDTDVSTVVAQVDKVVRVGDPGSWLAHFEFQSSREPQFVARLLQYNTILHYRHQALVESIVVLLRPAADGAELTGIFRRDRADGTAQIEFRYTVIRVWEQPVERVLGAALATLPLAPLARMSENDLPAVVRRVDERLRREATPAEADRLWLATYFLAGLRYTEDVTDPIFREVRAMRDSATYQAVIEEGRAEGRAEGEKRAILLVGEQRFGPPDERARRSLAALGDLDRIERITARLLQATSWEDLLATR